MQKDSTESMCDTKGFQRVSVTPSDFKESQHVWHVYDPDGNKEHTNYLKLCKWSNIK